MSAVGDRQVGRNTTHVAAGSDGLVVVKQFDGDPRDALRRYQTSLAWDAVQVDQGLRVGPPVVAHDDDAQTLSVAFVEGPTLQTLLDERASWAECLDPLRLCGSLLGTVHSVDLDRARQVLDDEPERATRTPDGMDPLAMFVALTSQQYAEASGGELECWAMFHHDPELLDALRTWATSHREPAEVVSVHGDLRPDQFIVGPTGAQLIDWEEWSIGSPTRDLAGIIGSLLVDALLATFGHGGAPSAALPMEVHLAYVDRGVDQVAAMAPAAKAFLEGYREIATAPIEADLLGADIGWALLERVLARATLSHRLTGADRAVAGVARQALIHPSTVLSALGLTLEETHHAVA